MAQALASMASTVLIRPIIVIRAQQKEPETSRRAMLGFAAAGIAAGSLSQSARAGGNAIKIGPPPPPSGGLPGTLNADEARDLDLPYKSRFYIQGLPPADAKARAIESAKDIIGVKSYIDKKAWPFVQMDLRNKVGAFRFDVNALIAAKSKEEKAVLKALSGKLFDAINKVRLFELKPLDGFDGFYWQLDGAAKSKDSSAAEKYYAETVSSMNELLSKLG